MRPTRRNDVGPAAVRPAPSLSFSRHRKPNAAVADVQAHPPTAAPQVIPFQHPRCPPPPWRSVGEVVDAIVSRLVVVDVDTEVNSPK